MKSKQNQLENSNNRKFSEREITMHKPELVYAQTGTCAHTNNPSDGNVVIMLA